MGSRKINFAAQAGTDASPCPSAALVVHRYDPTDARLPISGKAVAQQRAATLQKFAQLKACHGAAEAAALVGASLPTLWRWQVKFAARGLAGLQPKPASGGKPSPFAKVHFPVAAQREIEKLIVSTGNAQAAWQQFATSPLCPPLVARHIIQTGKVPARFASMGKVSQVQAACFISADGRRLLVAVPQGVLVSALALPTGFKLSNMKATR